MVALYYFLARDEERRMVGQFGDQYRDYMTRTGMFVPRSVERVLERLPSPRSPVLGRALGFVLLVVLTLGGGFALRAYTVSRLPLWTQGRIAALAILPADGVMLEHRMADVLKLPDVQSRLDKEPGPVLVYLIPQQYVMQGMIADIGPEWRLYEHHQTLAMISDWIFHPFRHLQGGGHMAMAGHMPGMSAPAAGGTGVVRRLIFVCIRTPGASADPASLFLINAERVPQFYADVDIHHLVQLAVKDLGPGTGWGNVPTPMF
jgi:hypothetical protein